MSDEVISIGIYFTRGILQLFDYSNIACVTMNCSPNSMYFKIWLLLSHSQHDVEVQHVDKQPWRTCQVYCESNARHILTSIRCCSSVRTIDIRFVKVASSVPDQHRICEKGKFNFFFAYANTFGYIVFQFVHYIRQTEIWFLQEALKLTCNSFPLMDSLPNIIIIDASLLF